MNATPSSPSIRSSVTPWLILGACLLLGALMGCGDDNPALPQNPGPRYLPSSTPQNTLENMRRAYTTRDSTGYDSLFDDGYTGTSFDPGTLNQLSFTKFNEARHIAALARTLTITNVTFQLPPSLIRGRDGADPPGWATITFQGPLIEITDGSTAYTIPADETMEFKFAPTTPSTGSPTDTTWHIVHWTELAP